MRITCPSCASHFELPSELLGKRGRALKCATCQHSWYQAAQVESLDLASVMGEGYAQQAQDKAAAAATAAAAAATSRSARRVTLFNALLARQVNRVLPALRANRALRR